MATVKLAQNFAVSDDSFYIYNNGSTTDFIKFTYSGTGSHVVTVNTSATVGAATTLGADAITAATGSLTGTAEIQLATVNASLSAPSGGYIQLSDPNGAGSGLNYVRVTDGGASTTADAISILNTNGTGTKAIELRAAAGGISIECADEKEVYIGNDNKDAYVTVAASATAGNEDIRVVNTNGTDLAAIELTASAGGITMTSTKGITKGNTIEKSFDVETTTATADTSATLTLTDSRTYRVKTNIATFDASDDVCAYSIIEGVFKVGAYLSFTSANVDTGIADSITVANNFTTGQKVILIPRSTSVPPTGLSNGTEYYVIKGANNVFQLATNATNAISSTAIALSGSATTGTSLLVSPTNRYTFNASTAVNVGGATAETITLTSTQVTSLPAGTHVIYEAEGGTDISGLTSGTSYYVVADTATTIKLASSLSNALAGTPVVDITAGSNETHSLIVPVQQVVANYTETQGGATGATYTLIGGTGGTGNNITLTVTGEANKKIIHDGELVATYTSQ